MKQIIPIVLSCIVGLSVTADAALVDPGTVSGLVGWYDAQQLVGADGTAVSTWSDNVGGTNTAANDLTQFTGDLPDRVGTQTAVAPTLQTVSLDGNPYRVVRFADHTVNDQYDLLRASNLVATGDTDRTIILAYLGGIDDNWSRPVGFGSVSADNNTGSAANWNLATDANGTSRFDGAFIDGYSAGLDRSKFVVRTAVMESSTSFDEYIDVLDAKFQDNQVLDNGNPNNSLNNILGNFYLGDIYSGQVGGARGDAQFDILEAIVFDSAISDVDRQGIQQYMINKYTDPLLFTDFSDRTVSSNTASDITWSTNGLIDPGSLTAVDENSTGSLGGLFDTANAQDHFTPDLNLHNEGPWSVTVPLTLDASEVTLEEVVIDYQHFSNSGAFQTAEKDSDWTISVTGSDSGLLETMSSLNLDGPSGIMTFTFATPLTLLDSETYSLKIIASGSGAGNNTGIESLLLVGQAAWLAEPVPEPSSLLLAVAGVIGLIGLGWRRRRHDV